MLKSHKITTSIAKYCILYQKQSSFGVMFRSLAAKVILNDGINSVNHKNPVSALNDRLVFVLQHSA